jgi:nitrogen-specific signal transduction histidine kinase
MATNLTMHTLLRQKAEELVKRRQLKSGSQIYEADLYKLIHELEVHQIEIEMQNEELMLSRSAAIDSAEKYIELYDFAPVGYFTLSREGKIIDVNFCGSQMLEKERSYLDNLQFISFVSDDTKPVFNLFLKEVFSSNLKESCEVSLLKKDNLPNHVQLTGFVTGNRENCLVNAMDITVHRQAETEIKLKNDELSKLNVEKDKLFSILAHDLRSPLSSLFCLTEILAKELNKMNQEEIQKIVD